MKNCRHSGGQRFFSICTTDESTISGDRRGRDKDEDDPRCDFCGTYEDLRGHVDSEKSSEKFYLCETCCRELHR
jgi:hypothetical protein